MKLPQPTLLLVTDRRQARWPLVEVVTRATAVGCRWISVREKDLSEDEQIRLVRTLLPIAALHGACVSLHGEAALAKAANADGVHLSARSNPITARELLGTGKLVGVSIHTIAEAEAIDPGVVDYAIAGPAFETASKPGYGPKIGRRGLADIVRAARVPVLAMGGINAMRVAEVLATGSAGIAVMGGVMRATTPWQEMKVLLATINGAGS